MSGLRSAPGSRVFLVAVAVCLVAAGAEAQEEAKKPESSPAARQQYSVAAGLQTREQWKLAAAEWGDFLKKFGKDPLAEKALFYKAYCELKDGQNAASEASFAQFIETHPKSGLLEKAYLYQGIVQYTVATQQEEATPRAEAYKKAAATFGAQLEKFPKGDLAAEALFYRGESLYLLGNKEQAIEMYAALVQDHAESPRLAEAMYALGVTHEELKQYEQAGKVYGAFLAKFEEHPYRTEIVMRLGETEFQAKNYEEAVKHFGQAAAAENFALADHATLRQAASLGQLERYEEAAKLYESIPAKFKMSRYAGAANLAGGNCYYLGGNYAKARELLSRVLDAGGETAAEAAHWIAQSLLKEDMPAEVLPVVDKVLPKAGESAWLPQLLMDKADALYELPERRAESVAVYQQVASQFPKHGQAPQAQYMAAFAQLGQEKYKEALAAANTFLGTYQEHMLQPDVQHIAAESQLQLGNHAEAEKLYAALVKNHADHPDAETWKVRWGLTLYLQKKHKETIDALAPLAGSLKGEQAQAEAQFLIGSSHSKLEQYEPAAAALQASLKASAKWRQADEAMLTLAHCQRQLDQLEPAIGTVRKMIEAYPESPLADRANYRLGEYLYAAENYPAAEKAYAAVVAKSPESDLVPYALYNLAWSQYSQGKNEETVGAVTKLIAGHAEHMLVPDGRYLRALALHQQKQYAPALEDLKAYLGGELSPEETADARYVLGLCQVGLKKHAEAVQTFEALLKEAPEYGNADKVIYELAWAQKDQDKKEEACAAFARLTKQYPDSSLAGEGFYHVGECQYRKGEYKEAIASYDASVARAGKSGVGENAAHKRAWAFYRLEDFAKSQEAFQKQLQDYPEGDLATDGSFMVAECLFKQDKFEEALPLYEKLPELENEDFAVLAGLHAAQAANAVKEFKKGEQFASAFLEKFPESEYRPEAMYEQAWAMQNTDRGDQALPIYEKVTELTTREVAARARFMIGEVHFANKNFDDAIRHFFRVRFGYSYKKWQADAQFEAGRCFEVRKQKSQAIKSYQDIVDNFPESDKVPLAKARLKELTG